MQESLPYSSQNHPRSAYFGPWRAKRSRQRLDGNFGNRTLPIGSKGGRCIHRGGGGLPTLLSPALGCGEGPPSGMLLLMVADVLRLTQVTHAGLAASGPTCRPPLRPLESPQNMELRHLPRTISSTGWCEMHSVLRTRVSTLQLPKSPTECLFWRLEGQAVTPKIGW